MFSLPSQHLRLFKSVFKGREDVFALRWESGRKSGYTPAYSFDPYLYRAHKMGGGTFQNFPDKKYLPLSDSEIVKHLRGEQLIGIYPLLPDNTSWFIAADFDDDNWLKECSAFIHCCTEHQIPAYLERSRSGKGLGNLIALPLYKKTLDRGNSCFLNPSTFQPYADQFEFLSTINRVSISTLNLLFEKANRPVMEAVESFNDKLSITLTSDVRISRNGMPQVMPNSEIISCKLSKPLQKKISE